MNTPVFMSIVADGGGRSGGYFGQRVSYLSWLWVDDDYFCCAFAYTVLHHRCDNVAVIFNIYRILIKKYHDYFSLERPKTLYVKHSKPFNKL